MGVKLGFALKFLQWFNRGVQFCCCALILALTSYFLAAMANHGLAIPNDIRAVEGISGVGVVYATLGVLLICCLAGFTLTSFLAMVLDTAFAGAFIYVATVYKAGAGSCSGDRVRTVFGAGDADARVGAAGDGGIPLPSYGAACRMGSANLAVAIVAIVFFLISAATELALGRHRKKEQRFGPSPANNYTSGYSSSSGGFFGALFKRRTPGDAGRDDDDPNALPLHTDPSQLRRQSYATDATRVDGGGAGATAAYPPYKHGEVAGYGGPPPAPPVGPTTNGFGNVPGHGPLAGRYGDGTYR